MDTAFQEYVSAGHPCVPLEDRAAYVAKWSNCSHREICLELGRVMFRGEPCVVDSEEQILRNIHCPLTLRLPVGIIECRGNFTLSHFNRTVGALPEWLDSRAMWLIGAEHRTTVQWLLACAGGSQPNRWPHYHDYGRASFLGYPRANSSEGITRFGVPETFWVEMLPEESTEEKQPAGV